MVSTFLPFILVMTSPAFIPASAAGDFGDTLSMYTPLLSWSPNRPSVFLLVLFRLLLHIDHLHAEERPFHFPFFQKLVNDRLNIVARNREAKRFNTALADLQAVDADDLPAAVNQRPAVFQG